MELHDYQQEVIADLAGYLARVAVEGDLAKAYAAHWAAKGVAMPPYQVTVPGVPHICVKVPTAGGKTFLGANALKTVFDALGERQADKPRFVVWLVPSLTILNQTQRAFDDPGHPYRQKLNALFNGRVGVYDKAALLSGAGFNADAVIGQLCIAVLSFDSLRARNKDDRKIFQDNANLATFSLLASGASVAEPTVGYADSGLQALSLIDVIRALEPVVVVDESHNATSELSVQMLKDLNPSAILELTATPRESSNIISFVDALALKKRHMVKLPVIVQNHPDQASLVQCALDLRARLERDAKAEQAAGGHYIRPIVLFQAEPRIGDSTTFDKVRQTLVKAGIPEAQIRIKTADRDEIGGEDLMHPDCPVRYIITVNALKEGWDCPFAYVLATLANRNSAVDVEQVLGRVLRQPHVTPHRHEALNLSYVLTSSAQFRQSLDNIVKGLNRAGFSDRDFRVAESGETTRATQDGNHTPPTQLDLNRNESGSAAGAVDEEKAEPIEFGAEDINVPSSETLPARDAAVDALMNEAVAESNRFDQAIAGRLDTMPADVAARQKRQEMDARFVADASALVLPQFHRRIEPEGFFADDEEWQLLEHRELLSGFRLGQADANVAFDQTSASVYRVDVEAVGQSGNTRPRYLQIDPTRQKRMIDYLRSQPRDAQIRQFSGRLCDMIGNLYPIADQEVKRYIRNVLEGLSAEQLHDAVANEHQAAAKIRQKINGLATAYKHQQFTHALATGDVVLRPSFSLPAFITPVELAGGIDKSLYASEAGMGGFEAEAILAIASLDNLVWWHRNFDKLAGKGGFRMNGSLNHYPDFLLRLRSGRLVVLETKGDDRDNSDSVAKLKLGKDWEAKAGEPFRYVMAFQTIKVAGAYPLTEAIQLISQM